ncbi:NadS family protein [Alcaligenes sp. WGS1538]|uniref:NadS family protein n=1 Tax=Alcaligenes sp. WGS1538 TaxID=3366811 RepID=UPI00228F16CD|nr:helix-turn-helix domain-containing protein [Escherichia coli]
MNDQLFAELKASLKEAKAIRKGEQAPARVFALDSLDVKRVREQTNLSQAEFAAALQVSVRTLQNWEQRRRTPTGPAAALLKVVANAPELALRALHG